MQSISDLMNEFKIDSIYCFNARCDKNDGNENVFKGRKHLKNENKTFSVWYVYMYICIYVYMYICIYVYMYICIYVCYKMTQKEK